MSTTNDANATISMRSSSVLIRDFAVLRGVEAERFLVLAHPQTDGQVDDLHDDRGDDDRVDPRRRDGDGLDRELSWVAVEEPVRAGRVHRGRGEDAGRERAPRAADAVARPHVEGVVDPQARSELHREV